MQDKNTIDQLKAIVADREKKCKNLEQELKGVKESSSNSTKSLLKDGGELMSAFMLHPKESAANESETSRFRPPSSTMSNYKPNSIETVDTVSSRFGTLKTFINTVFANYEAFIFYILRLIKEFDARSEEFKWFKCS